MKTTMSWQLRLFQLLCIVCLVSCQHDDNAIVGDPMVDCGDNHLNVEFATRNPFRGVVFVRDHLEDPSCRKPPSVSDSSNASLRLAFQNCGIERRLSVVPRGIFISTSVIVTFHPDFLTKVDRIYKVQCFYMEMDRRLEKEIKVSMPPPSLQTKRVEMPVCKYEVLDGTPTGPPVYHAIVGQMVYHKWSCESDQKDTFCMTVHSCFVDDGNGDRVQLLDKNGCALDKYLLTNLEYPEDLVAGREAHVYKYADRDNMYFDCQISVKLKDEHAEYCPVPTCPDPPRRRRSHPTNEVDQLNEVETPEMEFIMPAGDVSIDWMQRHFDIDQSNLCLSTIGISTVLLAHAIILFSAFYLIISSSCSVSQN